jgi:hypothetical protein
MNDTLLFKDAAQNVSCEIWKIIMNDEWVRIWQDACLSLEVLKRSTRNFGLSRCDEMNCIPSGDCLLAHYRLFICWSSVYDSYI